MATTKQNIAKMYDIVCKERWLRIWMVADMVYIDKETVWQD